MPDIDASIWQKYQDDDVLVFGLHNQGESPALIADFATQTGVTFPLVADVGGRLGTFDYPPGVGFPYPRDVVIGKDLVIRSIKSSFDVAEMDALVEGLLAEP